jgi:hypothetical protein
MSTATDLAAATGNVTVAATTTDLAVATATAVAKATATSLALTNATTTLFRLVVASPCRLRCGVLSLSASSPVVWVAASRSALSSIVCIVVRRLCRVGLSCHLIVCVVARRRCLRCRPSSGWRRRGLRRCPSSASLSVVCVASGCRVTSSSASWRDVVVCVVARCLGGDIAVCVVVRRLRHCTSSASRRVVVSPCQLRRGAHRCLRCRPSSGWRHCCVRRRPLSASSSIVCVTSGCHVPSGSRRDVVVCVVTRRLGGGVAICVVVRRLRRCPLYASRQVVVSPCCLRRSAASLYALSPLVWVAASSCASSSVVCVVVRRLRHCPSSASR